MNLGNGGLDATVAGAQSYGGGESGPELDCVRLLSVFETSITVVLDV